MFKTYYYYVHKYAFLFFKLIIKNTFRQFYIYIYLFIYPEILKNAKNRAQSSKCRHSYELNSANIKFVDNIDVSCPPPLLFYFSTRYYWREIEPAACRIFDLGVSLKGYLSTDKRGLRFLSITRKRGMYREGGQRDLRREVGRGRGERDTAAVPVDRTVQNARRAVEGFECLVVTGLRVPPLIIHYTRIVNLLLLLPLLAVRLPEQLQKRAFPRELKKSPGRQMLAILKHLCHFPAPLTSYRSRRALPCHFFLFSPPPSFLSPLLFPLPN